MGRLYPECIYLNWVGNASKEKESCWAKHVYTGKGNDESHKTLMLGICGNGDILKPLIILEESFPSSC